MYIRIFLVGFQDNTIQRIENQIPKLQKVSQMRKITINANKCKIKKYNKNLEKM